MMQLVKRIFLFTALCSTLVFPSLLSKGQNARKMAKYLRVMKMDGYNQSASFTFSRLNYDPAGMVDAMKNAFLFAGFKVISETSIEHKQEEVEKVEETENGTVTTNTRSTTGYVPTKYVVTFSYNYYYYPDIGPQCRDINGQIVDPYLATYEIQTATRLYCVTP